MTNKTLTLFIGFLSVAVICQFLLIDRNLLTHAMWVSACSTLIAELVLIAIVWVVLKLYVNNYTKIQSIQYHLRTVKTALDEKHQYFKTLFNNPNFGIALISKDGRLIDVNPTLCELMGYREVELLAMNYFRIVHPKDLGVLKTHILEMIDNKVGTYQSEQQCYKKNGEKIWTKTTLTLIRTHGDIPLCFMMQIENITEHKKSENRLRMMAYHDPLTGLANRNKLELFITQILASAKRQHTGFALLFLDIDHFKTINDSVGHESGDAILQIIGERLRNAIRDTDMVARLGGDEFVLLITNIRKSEAVAMIAQKVLNNVMQVIMVKGQEIYMTTSIGISFYPYDGQSLQTLMKNADLALYRAKDYGRNNFQFYTTEMTSYAQNRLALQNALGHALAKNEFMLNYQPKLELSSRKITGVEALLRWQNTEFGSITTAEMITLAEETGLIVPVTNWVTRTACKQLKKWHEMGFTSLTIAINCSLRVLKNPSFAEDLSSISMQEGVAPESIEIEITESIIMVDPENTIRVLYALKDLGFKIVIDNFGTGYWSLNNLRRLSVDKIKIDKSFIKQATMDEMSATITTAIIAMANKLNIKSVAEGVERHDQYEFLLREGCTEIQGHYLTQPLTDEFMTKFLKHPVPDAEVNPKPQSIT